VERAGSGSSGTLICSPRRQIEAQKGSETLRDRPRAWPVAQAGRGEPSGEAGDPGDRC
jgi:hypothetical protein